MKKKLAVLGDPIDHSWSPYIHNSFAEQFKIEINYEKIRVEIENLFATLKQLSSLNYCGVNITLPLKEEAYNLAIKYNWKIGVRAREAKAVNTILFRDEIFFVDNTDGKGLFTSLKPLLAREKKKVNVLICGAGGAARGILPMFSNSEFEKVVVVNRGKPKLEILNKIFKSELYVFSTIDEFNDSRGKINYKFDLIINATSSGVDGNSVGISLKVFEKCPLVVDIFYGPKPTKFMTEAKFNGAIKVIDGLGMLVEQAAESFSLWTGLKPETKLVLENLRNKIISEDGKIEKV